jgi:hypothetical protein
LNEFSPNISYKPDPCRPIKGQITPEEWLAFSKYNKDRAEKESMNETIFILKFDRRVLLLVYESVRLRESIFHIIGQSAADLESQGKASEYSLRKRLQQLERSLNELEWQKKQVIFISKFLHFVYSIFSRLKKKYLVMKMISIV